MSSLDIVQEIINYRQDIEKHKDVSNLLINIFYIL